MPNNPKVPEAVWQAFANAPEDYDQRSRLAAALSQHHKELLGDEAVYEGASAECKWLNPHIPGIDSEEERQNACEPFREGLQAAIDSVMKGENGG